jgi:hypothetical protein
MYRASKTCNLSGQKLKLMSLCDYRLCSINAKVKWLLTNIHQVTIFRDNIFALQCIPQVSRILVIHINVIQIIGSKG